MKNYEWIIFIILIIRILLIIAKLLLKSRATVEQLSDNFSTTLYPYLYTFRPLHVILCARMLLSLGTAFIQSSRDKITNMTLTIAKEFYRSTFLNICSYFLRNLSFPTANRKTRIRFGATPRKLISKDILRTNTVTTERQT